ncbi:DUF6470 family protein [Alkalihalobacterium chitinilyticum]|uniref:DUF6470 family protein n=1 Tax=Alkalihalobacterium chitinilyticum TaxID=2980103 RepID=A0ABT5VII2_9BACI|nr:DUF6470 family protein [Alkalihalobacterium chitinilyticum]MDE5414044.1 DUF6470 family protein [Alkalihalobacterium chitinilyticum]
MNLPQLHISTNRAEIGIRSQKPAMRIQQPHADLKIDQNYIDILRISKRASKLHIDQSQAFADANLKNSKQLLSDVVNRGEQKAMQYIAKVAQQGDQLMKIENGDGAIQQIAKSNSQFKTYDFNVGMIPRPFSVKINYDPGETNIQVNRQDVQISVNRNEPRIDIPKWQSQAYLKQKNSISFQAVGINVNKGL